jgi:hypothetical protein
MRPWAEPVALHPEQAGTPKQLIDRIVKQNLRPALGAWFGTPRIKDAWLGTAGCGLAPELTEYAFALGTGAVGRKAGVPRTVAAPRGASGSEPVARSAVESHIVAAAPRGLLLTSYRLVDLGFCELTFLDERISARLAPDHLRRLAVGAQKGASHSVAIPKSGLLRDNVKGVVCVFHQRARPL